MTLVGVYAVLPTSHQTHRNIQEQCQPQKHNIDQAQWDMNLYYEGKLTEIMWHYFYHTYASLHSDQWAPSFCSEAVVDTYSA